MSHAMMKPISFSFFFKRYGAPRDLPSFPTRRSSDLVEVLGARLPGDLPCRRRLSALPGPVERRHRVRPDGPSNPLKKRIALHNHNCEPCILSIAYSICKDICRCNYPCKLSTNRSIYKDISYPSLNVVTRAGA